VTNLIKSESPLSVSNEILYLLLAGGQMRDLTVQDLMQPLALQVDLRNIVDSHGGHELREA